MTQFLLVQVSGPEPDQFREWYRPLERNGDFAGAISTLFPDRSIPVWRVAPEQSEIDSVVDEARECFMQGHPLDETRLRILTDGLIARNARFAFFYAMNYQVLPRPRTGLELKKLLMDQLTVENANWELHLLWSGKA